MLCEWGLKVYLWIGKLQNSVLKKIEFFFFLCVGGRSSGFDVHVTAKLSYSVIAVRALVLIDEMHDGLIFQKQK